MHRRNSVFLAALGLPFLFLQVSSCAPTWRCYSRVRVMCISSRALVAGLSSMRLFLRRVFVFHAAIFKLQSSTSKQEREDALRS